MNISLYYLLNKLKMLLLLIIELAFSQSINLLESLY